MGLRIHYGGTFDPVHLGHLAIARAARDQLQVAVRLLPAADPPHRAAPGADAGQRAHMLALAIGDEPGLLLDLRELERSARQPGVPSYTVDTLRELRAELGPHQPLAWLVGADSLLGLTGWHDWEALFGWPTSSSPTARAARWSRPCRPRWRPPWPGAGPTTSARCWAPRPGACCACRPRCARNRPVPSAPGSPPAKTGAACCRLPWPTTSPTGACTAPGVCEYARGLGPV